MNNLFLRVEKVINEWDPINLFPVFPPNEYEKEISLICQCAEAPTDINELTECIYQVFIEHFGNNIFDKSKEECYKIASLLMD
jgi:hypothetical protein